MDPTVERDYVGPPRESNAGLRPIDNQGRNRSDADAAGGCRSVGEKSRSGEQDADDNRDNLVDRNDRRADVRGGRRAERAEQIRPHD